MLLIALILTTVDTYLIFDFVLKLARLLLIPFKEGLCPVCAECNHKGTCWGLTRWFKEDCIRQRKRCNIIDNNFNC